MNTNIPSTKEKSIRFQIVSRLGTPQIVILAVSIIWMLIFPNDSIIKYFNIDIWVVLIGIGTGCALAFLGDAFYHFAKKTKKFYEAVELFEQNLSPVIKHLEFVDIILMSSISGFCEEVFFRGLLFKKVGIIISSVAFGLLHLPKPKFWIYAVWACGSGAILALLFLWTNSILTPVIAHVTNNLIGMILLKRLKISK